MSWLPRFNTKWVNHVITSRLPKIKAVSSKKQHTQHTSLMSLCPGLPRWASTTKVKPIWILLKQWHQLGHMQVCTSLQTDNHASTPPLCLYSPDALPATQPTASKHWRQKINSSIHTTCAQMLIESILQVQLRCSGLYRLLKHEQSVSMFSYNWRKR